MSNAGPLPPGFSALEPFTALWACPTLAERDNRRLGSNAEQRLAFYEAASPLAASAFAWLDKQPLAQLSKEAMRLHHLMLSLVHVALAVEVQRDGEPIHAQGARRMPIVHCHSD